MQVVSTLLLMLAAGQLAAAMQVGAQLDLYRNNEAFDIVSHDWANSLLANSSFDLGAAMGCSYCGGDFFYSEPPPDDILYIPAPPLFPGHRANLADVLDKRPPGGSSAANNPVAEQHCNLCNLYYNEGEHLINQQNNDPNLNNRIITLLVAFLSISAVLFVYLVSTKRSKIVASMTRAKLFAGSQPSGPSAHQLDKNGSLNESISNTGAHIADPCFLRTNRDKNLTSPIISDHVSHKKTSIPSQYWAQPGSMISRTIRRIPNEYEVPSSQTNSTGNSSAMYADANEHNQRFCSPYNVHTYAEVRDVLDTNDHFNPSSNSSAMMSESNYDNNVYSRGSCVINNNGQMLINGPDGSVQMSDFNSMPPVQSMAYAQTNPTNHLLPQIQQQHSRARQNGTHTLYDLPPQRAQVIITSNNGVNPTLLSYKERVHDVI